MKMEKKGKEEQMTMKNDLAEKEKQIDEIKLLLKKMEIEK